MARRSYNFARGTQTVSRPPPINITMPRFPAQTGIVKRSASVARRPSPWKGKFEALKSSASKRYAALRANTVGKGAIGMGVAYTWGGAALGGVYQSLSPYKATASRPYRLGIGALLVGAAIFAPMGGWAGPIAQIGAGFAAPDVALLAESATGVLTSKMGA